MKNFCKALGLMAVLGSATSFANIHEVTQSLSMGGGLGRSAGASLDSGGGDTTFSMGASYYQLVQSQIQLGATFDFAAGDGSFFELLGGVKFNFGSKGWKNDFFVNPSVGFAKTGKNDLKFVFDAGFGKRFSLLENVTYSPTFSFYYLNDLRMRVDFIKFSIVF